MTPRDPESYDPYDDNLDVIVTFSDRSRWVATFFTYENINALRKKDQQTGESMNGAFFWASDMILIDCVSRERIEAVIQYLLDNDEFSYTFRRMEDVKPEDDDNYEHGFFEAFVH